MSFSPHRPVNSIVRRPLEGSGSGPPKEVFVAAGTAGGSGGQVVVKAVSVWLAAAHVRSIVALPAGTDRSSFPPGPIYRPTAAVPAVLGEFLGTWCSRERVYVGLSDRLPLLRRPAVNVMIAQNDFLYGPEASQDTMHQRLRVAVLRRWARASLRRADWVVVATTSTRNAVVSTGLIEPGRVAVRPIPPQDLVPARYRQAERIDRLILIGDVYAYKRLDWAILEIDAWAVASDCCPEVVHVGGAFESPAEKALHQAAAVAQKTKVRATGRLDHPATIAELAASDVLVFPSEHESYGLPLVEALAMGIPVVCRDIPQFREIAGEAARYFSGESGSLVAALQACAAREVRAEMARAGVSRVVTGCGWDVLTPPLAEGVHQGFQSS